MNTIRFNQHYVTNGASKARVRYGLDNRTDGRSAVTLYAKDYSDSLAGIFGDDYQNNTNILSDYFEKGRVVLFADSPFYAEARARAELNLAKKAAKVAA